MDSRTAFAGLILVSALLFLAGCTKTGQQAPLSPKQAYEALAMKSEHAAPMKASYKFELNFGQKPVMGFSSVEMHLDVFAASKEKTKAVASLSLLGQKMRTEVYRLNGNTVQCAESLAAGSENSMQCQVGAGKEAMPVSLTEVKSLDELFSDYNISFAGEKTFAGRKSECFLLGYLGKDVKDKNQFASLSTASLNGYSFKQETCLDKEKGFISYTKINTLVSQQAGKPEKGAGFTMTLTSYSPKVSEADLELPVVFSLGSPLEGAECTSNTVRLKITPFKEISGKKAVLKIEKPALDSSKGEVEQQVEITLPELELFKESDLNIATKEPLAGSKQLELCIGADCVQSGCWVFK